MKSDQCYPPPVSQRIKTYLEGGSEEEWGDSSPPLAMPLLNPVDITSVRHNQSSFSCALQKQTTLS